MQVSVGSHSARAVDLSDSILRAKNANPDLWLSTGYGVKYDKTMQNTRALPVIAQWQDGQVRAVFPKEAMAPGTALAELGRK